jgi:hypothetical protein
MPQVLSNGTLAERPEPDQGMIEFLGELGPAAKDALPALLELQAQMRTRSDEGSKSGAESAIPDESYVDVAIRRITSPALFDAPFRRGRGG